MTIKVGSTLICNNCGKEEFIPHADTGDVEARKVSKGEWSIGGLEERSIHKKKHYCPDCSDLTEADEQYGE